MAGSNEIIAREAMFGQQDGGERFIIAIEVGKPFKWGDTSATEWACAVTIEPFYFHTAHGEGSLQALCLALQYVRSQLNHFKEEGGTITWEDGQEWSLNSYWPLEPY